MKYKLLILLLLSVAFATAQTRQQLEQKKKKLNQEMQTTSRLINETKKSRKGTENQLVLTRQSIRQGQEYIELLNTEINVLNHDIDSIQYSRNQNLLRLEQLRAEYAINVRLLYRQSHRNAFSMLLYIISADDFTQGFRRFRYLQKLSSRRRAKAQEISDLTDSLTTQQNLLTDTRTQKEVSMDERENQQRILEQRQREQNKQLNSLKKKEKELTAKQKNQRAQIDKLDKKIQEAINAEIARQQAAAKKTNQGNSNKGSSGSASYELSKEEKLIAGNFAANKGRLPRPVERGNITGHFGVQPHPYLEKVTINNKGIYIQSPSGTEARAVFEGVVTKVFSISGSNQSVIIRHGNYSTVYSNLSSVYVKAGDKVTARQKIGKIFTDTENGNKTELYFLMYKDRDILNPESWLAR
ncbi:MAG: peptidoglycan DD-metalloendopeptidase family protein [bacterium]|nr:peptidoglycan DD-metalloendopeptidase family protein [Candidatus Minthenecus merdequi]